MGSNFKERPGPKKDGWRYSSKTDEWEEWRSGKKVQTVTGLLARFIEDKEK